MYPKTNLYKKNSFFLSQFKNYNDKYYLFLHLLKISCFKIQIARVEILKKLHATLII